MEVQSDKTAEQLLTRLGLVHALAAQSKAAAHRLAEAAGKHEEGRQAEIERLAAQIRKAGIGNDEAAEREYCRLLLERHRLGQAGQLAEQDAVRMPDLAEMAKAMVYRRRPLLPRKPPQPRLPGTEHTDASVSYTHMTHPAVRQLQHAAEQTAGRKPKPPKPATQLTMLDKSAGYCDGCDRVKAECICAEVRKGTSTGEIMPLEWVPPDIPRWGSRPTEGGPHFLPLNGIVHQEKQREMVDAMRSGRWDWHVPLVRAGDQLLTGSHRYHAAKEAGAPIPTITLDDLFREHGLDLEETWREGAKPFGGWINNAKAALRHLPLSVRERYGIDLG